MCYNFAFPLTQQTIYWRVDAIHPTFSTSILKDYVPDCPGTTHSKKRDAFICYSYTHLLPLSQTTSKGRTHLHTKIINIKIRCFSLKIHISVLFHSKVIFFRSLSIWFHFIPIWFEIPIIKFFEIIESRKFGPIAKSYFN